METRGRARAGVWASERTAAGHGRLLELLAHLAVQAVVDAVDDVRRARARGCRTREPLPADNRTMCLYIGGGRQPPDKLPPNLICIRARSS